MKNTIIKQNIHSISKTLKESFSQSGTPISTVNFRIMIDLLDLYDESVDATLILNNFDEIEKEIKETLESITKDFFKEKGYSLITFISQMITVEISIKSAYNQINNFIYVFPEITEFIEKGYHNGEIITKTSKPIKTVTGNLSLVKKEISQHDQTFICTNIRCSNKTLCIDHNGVFFLIDPVEKTIIRTVENKGCLKCGSILSKSTSLIKHEYVYVLSINDDQNFKRNFITVRSAFDLQSNLQTNNRMAILQGYVERDWKGIKFFRVLNCASKTEINEEMIQIEKRICEIRKSNKSTIEKLKEIAKDALFFKKKIFQADLIILLIVNIFNCKNADYHCNVFEDNICDLLSSPDSAICKYTKEKTEISYGEEY